MKQYYSFSLKQFGAISAKLTFILTVLFLFSACEKDGDPVAPLIDGEAPSFTLSSADGSLIKLSDYKNKVVVLFFFGNNCPSCKAAGPNVESMLVKPFASNSDYQVLGLDQWNGNLASVQSFKSAAGVSFPLLLQAAGVATSYNTTYDRLVVIDKSGKIVFSGTQGAAADIAAVKAKVETLLDLKMSNTDDPKTDDKNLAPAFTLNSLLGKEVKLSDYSNKVVVLFFFGNNCPPCKSAAPNVESSLVTPFAARTDYQVLGLDQWDGNLASVEAFKTSTSVSFPLLLLASSVASNYKTTYDRLVVIDKSGKIVFSGTQGAGSDIATVKAKVETLF